MENASKALLIAGGVLISVIIIGLIVMMFNGLGEAQHQTELEKEIMQITKYNQKFEQYNGTILYGSDIISVINLADDYNAIKAKDEARYGFTEITLSVKIESEISIVRREDDSNYRNYIIKKAQHKMGKVNTTNNIRATMNTINNRIQAIENKYIAKNKPIDTIIDMQSKHNQQLQALRAAGRDTTQIQNNYKNELLPYGGIDEVEKDIRIYTALNSTITSFRNKYFTCEGTKYDDTGRIVEMSFKEVLPD